MRFPGAKASAKAAAKAAPVLKYTGAKWTLIEWIREHLPLGYDRYVETHFGSGAVFFSREPVRRETINDIDGEVVHLFRVLRDPIQRQRLIEAVSFTPWAEEELQLCAERVRERYKGCPEEAAAEEGPEEETHKADAIDPVERARQFLVVAWMGISSRMLGEVHFRFASGGGTSNDYPPITWARLPERIAVAGARLAGVQILRRDAIDVVRANADPRVLLYVDPPYVRSTRTRAYYPYEMTDADHEKLLIALKEHPGAAVISGYDHAIYREALADWRRAEMAGRSQRNAAARTEILWLNDDAWQGCRASRNTPLFGV